MTREDRSYFGLVIFGVVSALLFMQTLWTLQKDAQNIQSDLISSSSQLEQRIAVIDKILAANPVAVSSEALAKYDQQYQTNFMAEIDVARLSQASLSASPAQALPADQRIVLALKEDRKEKESEKNKLSHMSTWSLLPPWRILLLGGLGAFCSSVISLLTDQLPVVLKRSPRLTGLVGFVIIVMLLVVLRVT